MTDVSGFGGSREALGRIAFYAALTAVLYHNGRMGQGQIGRKRLYAISCGYAQRDTGDTTAECRGYSRVWQRVCHDVGGILTDCENCDPPRGLVSVGSVIPPHDSPPSPPSPAIPRD